MAATVEVGDPCQSPDRGRPRADARPALLSPATGADRPAHEAAHGVTHLGGQGQRVREDSHGHEPVDLVVVAAVLDLDAGFSSASA